MSHSSTGRPRLVGLIHRYFLPLLIAAYALAAVWPGPGAYLRTVRVVDDLPLPSVLLSGLLFSAGLGTRLAGGCGLIGRLPTLALGLGASVLAPVAFVVTVAVALGSWHDPEESQALILGLALVAAMPIAGSSAAWTQHAGGDTGVSVGLILGSTALSPLLTPLAWRVLQPLAGPEGSPDLAAGGTGLFLLACVVFPTAAGLLARAALGPARVAASLPRLGVLNSLVLLTLCYANASTSLPELVANPDWDFYVLVLAAVSAMCAAGFGVGALLGRMAGRDPGQRLALTFGLGMSNNGTALVMAGSAFATFPRALLPILAYNLAQHLVAGAVSRFLPTGRRPT